MEKTDKNSTASKAKTSTSKTKTSTKKTATSEEVKTKITPKPNPAKAKRQLLNASAAQSKSSANAQNSSQAAQNSQIAPSKSNITNAKLISALKVIENISHTLGISDRERINFDIEQVSDNELKIRIVNAAANFHTPWFAIKNEEPYIFMPAEILDVVFKMLKTAQKESFELKLERSIWQNMPIDFGDVWRVAMDELMKSEFKKEPDLDKLIAKIKREHPNLFVDMSQMLK